MIDLYVSSAPRPASELPWEPFLALLAHLLWALVALGVLAWIGKDNLLAALRRINKVTVAGVELQFRDELQAAGAARGVRLSDEEIDRALRRLATSGALMKGARLLWVDDHPDEIVQESRVFEAAGARITRVRTTRDALSQLDKRNYDVVLSDIRRGDDGAAGLRFASALAQRQNAPPLIFYVGKMRRPTPDTAFGITNRPSELVHLTLDVLARVRS